MAENRNEPLEEREVEQGPPTPAGEPTSASEKEEREAIAGEEQDVDLGAPGSNTGDLEERAEDAGNI